MKSKKTAQNLTLLNQAVLESFGMADKQKIVQRFIKTGLKVLEADYAFSFLINPDTGEFELAYVTRNTPFTPIPPRKHGIVARAFQTRKPQLLSDVLQRGFVRFDAKQSMRGVAVIPITYKNRAYGTLHFAYKRTHKFTPTETQLAALIGNSAAQVFIIHQLYDDLHNFKLTLDYTLDALILFDVHSRQITYTNQGAQKQFGYKPEEFGALSILQLSNAAGAKQLAETIDTLGAGKKTHTARIEITCKTKSGYSFAAEVFLQYIYLPNHSSRFLAFIRNIEEQKRTAKKIQRLAYYDSLTKLPNRAHFQEELSKQIAEASSANGIFALLFLGLDRFKVVNEILGTAAGDRLLYEVGQRLKEVVKDVNFVGRTGGDEFVVMLRNITTQGDATAMAKKVLAQFRLPFTLAGQEVYVRSSMGIALFPVRGEDAPTLIKAAGQALDKAKEEGGGVYSYAQLPTAQPIKQWAIEKHLPHAIQRQEFIIYYQPQYSVVDNKVLSCEALPRWQHPELGLLTPDAFIPVAEQTGLIIDINHWIISQALQQHLRWKEEGMPPIRIAVNLSAHELLYSELVNFVRTELAYWGVPGKFLEFELTESMVMKNIDLAMEVLSHFHRMSIRSTIDDFGTGYSSISYLKRLPVDALKIDKGFISELPQSTHERAIVNAIISMAHEMRLQVVGEGVEKDAQWDFLIKQGCDLLQGHYISQGLPGDEFRAWYKTQKWQK
jgi:diguanylate cyclase (GGDEF)-like protein/PAS domain S-box-containing protein